jgi:hypothetical protein
MRQISSFARQMNFLTTQSSLVRRLVRAWNDPGKERVRARLMALDDAQLLSGLGLTPEDTLSCAGRLTPIQPRQCAAPLNAVALRPDRARQATEVFGQYVALRSSCATEKEHEGCTAELWRRRACVRQLRPRSEPIGGGKRRSLCVNVADRKTYPWQYPPGDEKFRIRFGCGRQKSNVLLRVMFRTRTDSDSDWRRPCFFADLSFRPGGPDNRRWS